ncbi:D-lyxose/D-mannose family sugar isomerase [Parabacteroides sp. Marseille-P3160]|uniref:D-lyxose/D-mannose family sugar isomerase n=1 Tax=Parabacteroides sp. Marseille-P3160 TaxID=1917887 RepID=UPI0009BA23F7|nr:D-lyxose/D-mannose family sugar isomerase [Parabacteroides sp. Marseille-P3160]
MKRSEINRQIDFAIDFFSKHSFKLPSWAYFSPDKWKTKGEEYDEIRVAQLGWDITDFGKGKFSEEGLTLFTVRNGYPARVPYKPYCEKIMIVGNNQVTPTHFHWKKMEDIINRGGGDLCIQLWKADERTDEKTEKAFTLKIDSVLHTFHAGDTVRLKPGESICFEPYVYHNFWAEGGPALVGEVSTVNDDSNDNRFYESLGRFPQIIEDEPARFCLCNEYGK